MKKFFLEIWSSIMIILSISIILSLFEIITNFKIYNSRENILALIIYIFIIIIIYIFKISINGCLSNNNLKLIQNEKNLLINSVYFSLLYIILQILYYYLK
jgi:hypothetical protein